MKYFRKLASTILFFVCLFSPHLTVKAEQNTNIVESCESPVLEKDAEYLYRKINNFLLKYKDVSPDKIDDVCKEVIGSKIPESNLLSKQDFEEKSVRNTVLYRGVENKSYADEFKNGKVFISCWNVRGSGIYTTTSLDCAKSYADKQNPDDTLIKAFISKDNVKILNNDYLEKLKELIIKKHSEEFGEFENKSKNEYIFDNLNEYVEKASADMYKKIDELLSMNLTDEEYMKQEEKLLKENIQKLEKDPIFQKLRAERKKYYNSTKAYVWFNSGLLTKLMDFDILYTNGSLRDFFVGTEGEYIIVNPNILNVLND